MNPAEFEPIFEKIEELERERNNENKITFYAERPLHPDLEKCFECEERGNGVVKWNKALGWQLLKAHYEGQSKYILHLLTPPFPCYQSGNFATLNLDCEF